ncbi:MAG: lipoyl(octanoyl) transferase LipB [Prevotella sp.]|jgi:lipoyl(octanoyl) transferase|nr:lipoyl(octanoyl) transferase LipB [Prevotella sp.]
MTDIICRDLGLVPYAEAWEYQRRLFEANVQAKLENEPAQNILLLCEHPHVITIGKHGKEQNLLFAEDFFKERGVELFRIDRGGDVTYHGPGQLVAYPIFDLETFHIGLRQYIGLLEEVMIRLLKQYGVKASRCEKATGVWIDADKPATMRKIGAIGVRSSHYITMHGFALNIHTDLSYFSLINPCGFTDRGVTSLFGETGRQVNMTDVKGKIRKLFDEVFVQGCATPAANRL